MEAVASKIKSIVEGVKRVSTCRACRAELPDEPVFSMGKAPVVYFPEKADDPPLLAPLNILECAACGLAQLSHTVSPDALFRHFWYRSGVTRSMRSALLDVYNAAMFRVQLQAGNSVLDIGCNDGSLLELFPSTLNRVGYEPAEDIAAEAACKGLDIVPDYFSLDTLRDQDRNRFKMIFAVAMFYDIDDLSRFMQAVRLAIKPQGIFVVQMNYLGSMLKNLAVDNIVHEHVTYFSAAAFQKVVEAQGFSIIAIETNDVNGGSIRLISKLETKTPPEVEAFIAEESEHIGADAWQRFAIGLYAVRSKLVTYFDEQQRSGKTLSLCGASTRGLTALYFLGLARFFCMAGERDPNKWGRYYGSTGILIFPEEHVREESDVMLVLPWHFEREIREREQAFLEKGGTLVIPFPRPKIVTVEGESFL